MGSGNKGQSRNNEDISGQKFESLTALRPVGQKLSQVGAILGTLWECQCTCGRLRVVLRKHLGKATKQCETCVASSRFRNFNGYKKPNIYTPVEASVKTKIRLYARRGKHKWSLTETQAFHLFTQECFYCGKLPELSGSIIPTSQLMGIDRKDSDLSYTMENSVSCCKNCNYAKNELSITDFFSLVKRIANKHKL